MYHHKLFTLVMLCLGMAITNSYAQDTTVVHNGGVTTVGINASRPVIPTSDFREDATVVTVTYNLDGGNMEATDYDPTYFSPEPLHPHNVQMESIVHENLDGVFSNGWEESGDYDTTQYLHLRVNINTGYILHLDSVTFTGTGASWYGPIVGGVVIFDADTLCGSTVGWQICDSILYCASSMWYMMPHPYDTLVNWWQINSRTHLDIRLIAWGNITDTLGNYMPSTGWVVDHIQLHGKILNDLSTGVAAVQRASPIRYAQEEFLFTEHGEVRVYDVTGKVKAAGLQGQPFNTTNWTEGVYVVEFISSKQQRYTERFMVKH